MSELAEEILVAQGGLNYDDDPRMFGQGDTDYRLNVIPTELGDTYVLTNIKGTTKKSHSFTHHADYAGATYTTLGSCYDIKRNAIYYFLYSDLTNHCIIRYNIDDDDFDKIVWDNPLIGLDSDYEITDAFMIDNWLHWNPQSSSPRAINVEWAYYDYVSYPISASVTAGQYVKDAWNKVYKCTQAWVGGTTGPSENTDYFDYVSWCYNDVYAVGETGAGFTHRQRPFFNTVPPVSGEIQYEFQTIYRTDGGPESNNIRNKVFQFTYRFYVPEMGYTITAPYTKVLGSFANETYNGEFAGNPSLDNAILLTVNPIKIKSDDAANDFLFDHIEILVRSAASDNWQSVYKIPHSQVVVDGNAYAEHAFYNDKGLAVVDNAAIEKPYNFLPRTAKAQTSIDGERSGYVGIKEGFDIPNIDVDLDYEYEQVEYDQTEASGTAEATHAFTYTVSYDYIEDQYGNIIDDIAYYSCVTGTIVRTGAVATEVLKATINGGAYYYTLVADDVNTDADYAAAIVKVLGLGNIDASIISGNRVQTDYYDSPQDIEVERYDEADVVDEGTTSTKYRTLKSGAWHAYCLYYWDNLLRRCEAIPIDPVYVPALPEVWLQPELDTGTGYRRFMEYTINHDAPSWAAWWGFGYAGNTSISKFWHYNIAAAGQDTTSTSEYENLSYVDISPLQGHKDDGDLDVVFKNSNIDLYEFEKGDRIRFLTEANDDDPATSNAELAIDDWQNSSHDYEIVSFNPTTNYIYFNSVSELEGGVVTIDSAYSDPSVIVEIYRPKKTGNEVVYYEIGGRSPVTGSGAAKTHSNATGTLDEGDCYLITRTFSTTPTGFTDATQTVFVESYSWSDFYDSEMWSRGKIGSAFGLGERNLNNIRYSNKLSKNTLTSGLSTFDGLDYKSLSYNHGDVTAMRQIGGVLKVIFENNVASVLVNRTQFFDADGQSQVVKSDEVLGSVNYSEEAWGSVNPESVEVVDRNLYFFDLRRKAFVRNAPNGSFPISDYKMRKFFIDKANELVDAGESNIKVRTAWDDDHDMLYVGITTSVDGALVSYFSPSIVRNDEVNNLDESSETNLIEITDVNGSTITVNYLPESAFKTGIDWFALNTDSFDGAYPDPIRTGDYHTYSKIASFDFTNKEIELVDATDFSVGDHLAIYSPWANYEFLPNQENAGIVGGGGTGWRSLYVASGPSWYNEDEDRYYVLINGVSSTYLQVGYAYCDDITTNNWIIGNSDAPIIENGDDPRFATRVGATGNIMDNGDGTVSFLLNGTDSGGNWNISVCTMKKDTSEISFSSILDTTDQLYTGNSIVYYDGKYTILGTIYNATVNQRTVEMWQSNTIDSGYTKTCDVFTTEYDNNDSIWLEGHSDGSCVFVENGTLYSFQAGTQRYNASGLKSNRVQGLMKYDDDTNSWSPVNHFAPEIIHPMYFHNIPFEDYGWASDHCGGNQSFIKKDGKCYFFVSMNHGTDTYQIAALEISYQSDAPSQPADIVLFHEPTNRWVSFVSPYNDPDVEDGSVPFMLGTASGLFSHIGEDLYVHNSNDTRCYLWDTQRGYQIRVYGGLNAPNIIKVFDSIALHTNKYLDGEDVQIPATINYPNGMESRLPEVRFEKEEGVLRSDYLCNMKSTSSTATIPDLFNGDTLRGYIIYHDFVGDETDEHTLYKVDILTTKSKY